MLVYVIKSLYSVRNASCLVILCYSKEKIKMSNSQSKILSLKLVPYLFIAVTVLTAFGSNGGTWA